MSGGLPDVSSAIRTDDGGMTTIKAHPTTNVLPIATSRTRGSATDPHPARTLWIAASGTLLVLAVFSAFVVTVGDSARSLHAGAAGETWALSGMSLGLATALLAAGSLADDLGYRRVLICSAALLAVASTAGALAPSIEALVAARVLQGVSGGGVLAASLGSIGRAFPVGPPRTHATGV
jgi:MFS family permease